MKRILMAGAALAVTGAAAFALDDDSGAHQTRIHVAGGHDAMVVSEDGQVVEVRGANGDRTIHVDRDGERSVINVDGQQIEINDGVVTVDGEVVETAPHSVVIIDGDEVRVIEGHHARMGREFEVHMAERAEHLARMENHIARMVIDVDGADIEATVLQSLEQALAGLDDHHVIHSGDWDELSDEERAEVRAELDNAREEIREAMQEVRREMRGAHAELEGERRRARVEIRRAARDMARAEHDVARARVEVLRGHEESRHADVERLQQVMGDTGAAELRIEEIDGRQRVWVDGEEQTGDELIEWLNRLEVDRLAGGHIDADSEGREMRRHARVERIQRGDSRQVIEMDGGERVVIIERRTTDDTEND
ncbi:hypothetical protein [Maricaulis sp.]|uniref:hypothetical protein n=1 Tax=Maricaulis sp. TaxID=1486257 RepID=UPI002B27AB7F|nr:hypothetical protein [Maricaulis sp.]